MRKFALYADINISFKGYLQERKCGKRRAGWFSTFRRCYHRHPSSLPSPSIGSRHRCRRRRARGFPRGKGPPWSTATQISRRLFGDIQGNSNIVRYPEIVKFIEWKDRNKIFAITQPRAPIFDNVSSLSSLSFKFILIFRLPFITIILKILDML